MDIGYTRNKFLTALSVFAGVTPLITFLSSFITAWKLGHLKSNAKIPSIKEITAQLPESTIFSIGICTGLLIHITLIYARYIQVLTFRYPACPRSNDVSCYFGPLIVFGESIISSFRQLESPWAFYFGKTIFFASSCIYIGIQAYISIHTPAYHRKWIAYTRCIFTVISSICPILSIVGISIERLQSLDVPQAAELTLLIIVNLFWITFAFDFKDNDVVYLFRYYEIQSYSPNIPSYCLKKNNNERRGNGRSHKKTEDGHADSSEDLESATMKQIITTV